MNLSFSIITIKHWIRYHQDLDVNHRSQRYTCTVVIVEDGCYCEIDTKIYHHSDICICTDKMLILHQLQNH